MPVDYKKYPAGWGIFSNHIRFDRAGGRCECTGQCGLHPPVLEWKQSEPKVRRCIEKHGAKAMWANGRIILTVAHLCQCDPICKIENHVLAMCQRCHLRVDNKLHTKNARATREARDKQMKLL